MKRDYSSTNWLEEINQEGVEVRKSCCYFCHQNCGVLAYVKDGKLIYAQGDPDHPTNAGGLCTRGNQALTFVDNPSRINYPLKRAGKKGENKWERVSWDQALTEIGAKLNQIKEESGAQAVAAAAGTLRTDDWARRRFLNLFGTPNGFHNALLCWIPTFMVETAVSGWSPFETDLGGSKCVILWGFNPGASSMPGMHGYTDLQRVNGLKIIVVDPRYSETAAHADLWLPLRPGSDTALSLAMINVIMNEFIYDMDFTDEWCEGFDDLRDFIEPYTPEWAEPITWLDPELIRQAARMYATNRPSNIQWGCTWDQLGRTAGAGMHARSILRAICGNLDVPGGDGMPGPAAYITDEEMEANDRLPDEVKKYQIGSDKYKMTSWPGYERLAQISKDKWGKAFTAEWMCEAHGPSVFKAILTGDPYQVRALFVSGSNPLSSYGDSKMVYEAIKKVEFMVVLEYFMTPTALQADFILPVAGAMERPMVHTNYGVTDSIVASQRAIWPMYERKTDYNIWKDIGLACGQTEEDWPWPELEDAYFHTLSALNMPISSYDDFVERYRMYYPPVQYQKHINRGQFCTASGKVEIKSSVFEEFGLPGFPEYIGASENEIDDPEVAAEYPIVLTTGGGFMPFHHSEHFNNPIIRYIKPDPYFTIHPELAEKLDIVHGDWCWIETRRGRIKMRANVEPSIDPRAVYTQRGWWFPERSHEGFQPFGCFESNTNVLTSVDDEHCDPYTGCWANRGLMCKVYKCTDLDFEFTEADAGFSIPGSDFATKGAGVHAMPSEQKMAREFAEPIFAQPDFDVPEGVTWDYRKRACFDEQGRRYDPASGWLVDDATNTFYQLGTGYKYVAYNGDFLLDEVNGAYYDFSMQPVDGPQPDYELPAGTTWNKIDLKAYDEAGRYFDKDSGWMIDPVTNIYYQAGTGYRYVSQGGDFLVDEANNAWFDFSMQPVEAPQPTFEVPEMLVWDPIAGIAKHPDTGYEYDPNSGWLIDKATNAYYEKYTMTRYDAATNTLVDDATGKHYSMEDPTVEVTL